MTSTHRRTFIGYGASLLALLGCKTRGDATDTARLSADDDGDEFDYIVIGSGAGGGPVAVNLAKAGFKTLVLEAGSDHGNREVYTVPGFHSQSTEDTGMAWDYYVKHFDKSEDDKLDPKYVDGRGILYPRAGTLGGCTAHNAMITVYPLKQDWHNLAADVGDRSYSPEIMRRYFQFVERAEYHQRSERRKGWLPVNFASPLLIAGDKVMISMLYGAAKTVARAPLKRIKAIASLFDLVVSKDTNLDSVERDRRERLVMVPLATTAQGRRYSTRDLLKSQEGRNLVLRTNCLVTKILFDENSGDGALAVKGVEYRPGPAQYKAGKEPAAASSAVRVVRARREVIVAAGTFNSPQLLMLSGIGPQQDLQPLTAQDPNFKVWLDRPGVGRNLQDRYEVGVVARSDQALSIVKDCKFVPHVSDPCFAKWKTGKGPYTSNGAVVGILKKSKPEVVHPDLFILCLPTNFRGYHPGYADEITAAKHYVTWTIMKANTHNNSGFLKLKSLDPTDTPEINFRYFQDGNDRYGKSFAGDKGATIDDLEAVASGVEYVREILKRADHAYDAIDLGIEDAGEFFTDARYKYFQEVSPGMHIEGRKEIREWVRKNAWGHHACGTCKMGKREDPMAVVDSKFRVIGTKNLRIMDASIFPRIPGYYIASSIYTMAERASDEILADAGIRRRVPV